MLIESVGPLAVPVATRDKVPIPRAGVDNAPARAAGDAARSWDGSAVIVAVATALEFVCQVDAFVPFGSGKR